MLAAIFEPEVDVFLVVGCQTGGLEKGLLRPFQVNMEGPAHQGRYNTNCPSQRLTLVLALHRGRFCKG